LARKLSNALDGDRDVAVADGDIGAEAPAGLGWAGGGAVDVEVIHAAFGYSTPDGGVETGR